MIAIPIVNSTPVIHYLVPDNHAFGMDKCKARPSFVEAEQIQLSAQHTMVASFSLLQPCQIIVKLFLVAQAVP